MSIFLRSGVGVTDWLQAHDAGVDPPDRQLVVHQVFVLLAIVHGLGFEDKLSLWGSFTGEFSHRHGLV